MTNRQIGPREGNSPSDADLEDALTAMAAEDTLVKFLWSMPPDQAASIAVHGAHRLVAAAEAASDGKYEMTAARLEWLTNAVKLAPSPDPAMLADYMAEIEGVRADLAAVAAFNAARWACAPVRH